MEPKTNPWHSILNSLANIVLALSAVAVIGLFAYYKHYYLAAGLIALGVFVYVILQFVEALRQSQDVLIAQALRQEDFYRNWLNYFVDINKGIDPIVAHGINNVPPAPPKVESNDLIVDLPTLEGVHARKVRA
jgi:hypothetical protein